MNWHQPSDDSQASASRTVEGPSYDPFSWMFEWPHEDTSVWDAWSKVHARFGVAAQRSNEIETALIMLVAQMEQVLKRDDQIASLLTTLAENGGLPMGRLITTFVKLYGVPSQDPLCDELERARKARNYLIHHFYRDRAELFKTLEGCNRLVEMLVSIYDDFDAALQYLEDWREKRFGPKPPEAIWEQINEDVTQWQRENQEMLDAISEAAMEYRDTLESVVPLSPSA